MRPSAAAMFLLSLAMPTAFGCLNLDKSYPEKRSFVLDVGAPPQGSPSPGAIVLKINKFRVSPLFAGRAMVYRIADLQYENRFLRRMVRRAGPPCHATISNLAFSIAGLPIGPSRHEPC